MAKVRIFASFMTVGVYAVAIGENKRSQLQGTVMQALAKHPEIVQVHGRDPYLLSFHNRFNNSMSTFQISSMVESSTRSLVE